MSRNKLSIVCALTALSTPLIPGCLMPSSQTDIGNDEGSFVLNLPAVVEGAAISYELYCTDQAQLWTKESYKLVGSSGSTQSGFTPSSDQGSYKFSFPTNVQAKSCYLQGKGSADASIKSKIRFLDRDGLFFDSDPKTVTDDNGKLKLSITLRARYQLAEAAKQNTSSATHTATATSTVIATQATTERNSGVAGQSAVGSSLVTAGKTSTGGNLQPQPFREVQLIMDGSPQTCPSHICNP
jgi:hypothetical protein